VHLHSFLNYLNPWIQLFRWNKPTGRLILLIPAAWSLWLSPSSPPSIKMFIMIILGGISISAAGCIINDLWDQNIDRKVARTSKRPLVIKSISQKNAIISLIFFLILSLLIASNLPNGNQNLILKLSFILLPFIVLYPTAKRWFQYPQILLSFCWGFCVLIPWAAQEGDLKGVSLFTCWLATCLWTFGFDTVYAIADREDDKKIGINSSAISLKTNTFKVVSVSYSLTILLMGISCYFSGISIIFWPLLILIFFIMQYEVRVLEKKLNKVKQISIHFRNQSLLGTLLLLSIILGKILYINL
tara:strand:+ start:9937 stop:10839 length:903 start_codon:yes stop_codon:yes gene_type:complete